MGFSVMRIERIGRKLHYCGKVLLGLTCCAAGAMALLLAGNGAYASAGYGTAIDAGFGNRHCRYVAGNAAQMMIDHVDLPSQN
jgi:hypothetical protein